MADLHIPSPRSESAPAGAAARHEPPLLTPEAAKAIAIGLHQRQTDKVGEPYWKHVVAVGDMVALLGGTSSEIIAGYLHDSVEDGKTTIEALRDMGATELTLEVIDAVSKREGEANEDSLRRVLLAGRSACLVKFADLLHNTRHDRVEVLYQKAFEDGDDAAMRRIHARLGRYRHWIRVISTELGLLDPEERQ